jgi:hypothetical protein
MMDEDEEDGANVWLSAFKVVLAIVVLVGAVGGALIYYNAQPQSSPATEQAIEYVRQETAKTPSKGDVGGWGIFHDSPLRRK